MHTRLLEIIKYKTAGKQVEFARLLGWSPQYLAKMLKGESFGIQPVLKILKAFPEIDARWLLLGEGKMLIESEYTNIRKTMYQSITQILDLEKFIPVMTSEELTDFEKVFRGKKKLEFSDETIEKWEYLLKEKEDAIEAIYRKAYAESLKKPSCRQKRAKK